MSAQDVAKAYIRLPDTAMYHLYGNADSDSPRDLYRAVRRIADGDGVAAMGAIQSNILTLAAHRPEWEESVTVSVNKKGEWHVDASMAYWSLPENSTDGA